jgi:uncharacterized protein
MYRLSPTRRPTGQRMVQRQNWSHLLFLHWEVPSDLLQSMLPPGLTLDTFDGRAYVGLVPFTMSGVRPVWAPPVRGLSDFHETNLRTYVHLDGQNPGVWFFSLDAANSIAVKIARGFWKLPYHRAAMRMNVHNRGGGAVDVDYSTRRLWPEPLPADCAVQYRAHGDVTPAVPGSLEHFLAERYLLYAFRSGRLYRGQVYHTPYPLQQAEVHTLRQTITTAAGISVPESAPLAHYASGVNVEIYGLHTVKA